MENKAENKDKIADDKIEKLKNDKNFYRNFKIKSKNVESVKSVRVPINSSDMIVVTKVKNLMKYIFQITEKSPKKFRFTFANRLQDTAMECISNLYYANSINLKNISEKNA